MSGLLLMPSPSSSLVSLSLSLLQRSGNSVVFSVGLDELGLASTTILETVSAGAAPAATTTTDLAAVDPAATATTTDAAPVAGHCRPGAGHGAAEHGQHAPS